MMGSPKHVDLVDHLRGIAIIAVLFFHTLGVTCGYDALPWNGWCRDFSNPLVYFLPFCFGQAGVAVFFVVSGFCIHLNFQPSNQGWGVFFIRRIFRIYPAYLAALLLFIFIKLAHPLLNDAAHASFGLVGLAFWRQLLAHLFLVHNAAPVTLMTINPSFWSLAIEAQLYVLYPVVLWLTNRFGWRRTLIMLAVIELCLRGSTGLIQSVNADSTGWGQLAWVLANSPLGYWFSWTLGAYLAEAYIKGQPLPFLNHSTLMWLALAVGSYFIKPLYPFMFLLFAMLTTVMTGKLLSKVAVRPPTLSLSVLKQIGLWSYSIYLLHQPLLNTYSFIINWLLPPQNASAPLAFLLIVCSWLLIIPFSKLWYDTFELPGIAWSKRIIQKPSASASFTTSLDSNKIMGLLVLIIGTVLIDVKLSPASPEEINNQAWSLATNPDIARRNGAAAVKLAEAACNRTKYQETILVGTLAAAYAEAGRFDDAITTAQKACALATQAGNQTLLQRNQELLNLYLKHQPFHESSLKPDH